MELDNLDILKNIKRIEVPDALYHTIECGFEKNRENNIPILKVGIAASFVIGLMLAQFYLDDILIVFLRCYSIFFKEVFAR